MKWTYHIYYKTIILYFIDLFIFFFTFCEVDLKISFLIIYFSHCVLILFSLLTSLSLRNANYFFYILHPKPFFLFLLDYLFFIFTLPKPPLPIICWNSNKFLFTIFFNIFYYYLILFLFSLLFLHFPFFLYERKIIN